MTQDILNRYAIIGVELLKALVSRVSATNKTKDSIRAEVPPNRLLLFAREFFEALETGRGPRKSDEQGDFKDSMLEYMKAKGIGNDLDEKKREQLARFLTYRANKEGDALWKKGHGGKVRNVYSDELDKFVSELTDKIIEDKVNTFADKVLSVWH